MQERELRLREYMRVLGMLDAAYWGSWFATHMIILMVSGALCAYVGQCAPFSSIAACGYEAMALYLRYPLVRFNEAEGACHISVSAPNLRTVFC